MQHISSHGWWKKVLLYYNVCHVRMWLCVQQPVQMGLSQMLYHEAAMMGHQHHHLPPPPACSSSSSTFVDNREKIKQWIAEQGQLPTFLIC